MEPAKIIRKQRFQKSKSRPLRRLGLVALAGGSAAGLASFGAARYLVNQLTRLRPVQTSEAYSFSPFETEVDFEDVEFPTAPGRILKGWWLPRPGDRRVI